MFDDNMPGGGEPPKNLPIAEPEDMFAKTESLVDDNIPKAPAPSMNSALTNGMLKKKDDVTMGKGENLNTIPKVSTMPPGGEYETKEPVVGKIFIVLIIVAAAAGLGYGAWRFYVDYTDNSAESLKIDNTTKTSETMSEEATTSEETLNEEVPESVIEETVPEVDESILDDDKDSLNNAREKELGTDPMSADTDNDGLRDGDEVTIWQTDPLNPDSDGDSYLDGEEIKNGYNPLGPGKLFNNETSTTTSGSEDTTLNI